MDACSQCSPRSLWSAMKVGMVFDSARLRVVSLMRFKLSVELSFVCHMSTLQRTNALRFPIGGARGLWRHINHQLHPEARQTRQPQCYPVAPCLVLSRVVTSEDAGSCYW